MWHARQGFVLKDSNRNVRKLMPRIGVHAIHEEVCSSSIVCKSGLCVGGRFCSEWPTVDVQDRYSNDKFRM